jgi:hypothetical protein
MRIMLTVLAVAAASAWAMAGEGEKATGPNPKIAALGDNQWVNLNPPRPPNNRRNYSGFCMGDGVLWFWGGGHKGYRCNDVEVFDLAANQWRQLTEAESNDGIKGAEHLGSGEHSWILTAKRRPITQHSYQTFCWIPERKKFFGVLTPGTVEFDPEKKEWTFLTGPHAGKAGPLTPAKYASEGKRIVVTAWKTADGREVVANDPSAFQDGGKAADGQPVWKTVDGKDAPDIGRPTNIGTTYDAFSLVFYDPVIKKPVYVRCASTFKVFDFEKLAWEKVEVKGPAVKSRDDSYSVWVPDAGCHIVSSSKWGWWRLDMAKLQREKVEGVPDELVGCQALAYDSLNKVVLAIAGSGEALLWTYDPGKNLFAKVPAPKSPEPPRKKGTERGLPFPGCWANLWYDPAQNACILVVPKRPADETWAYRYRRAK